MNPLLFTPLSLSQLLKKKGVKQISQWYWRDNGMGGYQLTDYDNRPEATSSAFQIGELPDVFRQVFDTESRSAARVEWACFLTDYFKDPKIAWSNLEEAIKSL